MAEDGTKVVSFYSNFDTEISQEFFLSYNHLPTFTSEKKFQNYEKNSIVYWTIAIYF